MGIYTRACICIDTFFSLCLVRNIPNIILTPPLTIMTKRTFIFFSNISLVKVFIETSVTLGVPLLTYRCVYLLFI